MRKSRRKFGAAFSEELAKVSIQSSHFKHQETSKSWSDSLIFGWSGDQNHFPKNIWRRYFLIIFIILTFFGLSLRLFHLQVVQGSFNREIADSNRIQIRIIHAPRGVIYDRNGKILAQNEPGFRIVNLNSKTNKTTYLTRDEALKLEVQNNPQMKDLEVDNLRSYPESEVTAHIVGYLGEITEDELKNEKYLDYKVGDQIGRLGVEQVYEKVLKGVDGGEVIEVDAQGKKVRTLRKTEAIPGQNIYLTIDEDLQTQAYKILREAILKSKVCCGATVAQDPNTGQILSLVSIPSFDPTNISDSLTRPDSPFLNRVIAGTYPPGSIFKIVSALAGLSSGKITSKTEFDDIGVINLGPYKFANWYFTQYGRTEGMVNIIKALQRSNDTYFYNLGEITGEKQIADTAKNLGFGKTLGIDLPGETAGVIPDNDWKVKNLNQVWYPGDTLHMAIGQGFVLTTPLQINNLISEISQNGNSFKPQLISKITSSDDKLIKEFKENQKTSLNFKKDYLNLVKEGLSKVPMFGGTAWPFFTFPIPTAGKTGTAEYGAENATHAWYTTYAPVDEPTVALTVLVEGGGEGSSVAAPVAKEILRYYFSTDKKNLIKDLNQIASDSAKTLGE
ncbi:penicillin-binding protein 2 [Candidatus Daviesbacteria bacterium]|nr:penicillin-binding protein 2 [Candidatus Daviesbacteria bacterium]